MRYFFRIRLIHLSYLGLALLLSAALLQSSAFADGPSEVEKLLTERHDNSDLQTLERLAGGKDQLVDELLRLREKETPPYLSVRAEKLLLNFSGEEKVLSALEGDMENPKTQGLARIVALHFDRVSDESARKRLEKSITERAAREPAFQPYLRGALKK